MSGRVEERATLTGTPGSGGEAGDMPPLEKESPLQPTDRPLWKMRRIGFAVLGLQALGLFIWSWVVYHRFALESDFAGYDQAWYLMAHGHLNPTITVWGNRVFLKSHFEIIMLLLAPLWWISHSGVTLPWIADAALVVAECVAFSWMCEVAAEKRGRDAWKLATLGLFFLVANPWIYWALSFDFHAETLGACFALLAAFDLAHQRHRAWLWIALCLSCGDVCATYIAGVGISAVLAGKPTRRIGLLILGMGAAATGVITLIGANSGSGLASYAATPRGSGGVAAHASRVSGLGSLLSSPFRAPAQFFHDLWPHRLNVYANLAPAGGIGIFCAWGFGVPFLVLLENNLRGGFSVTAAQNVPIYCFVSLGTVMVLARIAHWKPIVAWTVAIVLALSTLGWFVVWFPRTSSQWLRVNPAAAAAIARVTPSIPPGAEVVAGHGVEGPLAGRTVMYPIEGVVPVTARPVYFVSAPSQGIETTALPRELSELEQFAQMGGRVISAGGGAWVLKWAPPASTNLISFAHCDTLPAWAMSTQAGMTYTRGPVSGWGMSATGGKGYVLYGAYDREAPGNYDADVTMTSHGPLSVEVWDSDRNILLARRIVPATGSKTQVVVPYVAPAQMARPSSSGTSVFSIIPVAAPRFDQIEVRVYSAGGVRALVSTVRYEAAPKAGHGVAPPTSASC